MSTLVVTAIPNIDNKEEMQLYLDAVMPLFMKSGGQLVKRMKIDKVIAGTPAGMILIMDFEDGEKIKSFFDSDEYIALIPLREKGFKVMNMYIADSF